MIRLITIFYLLGLFYLYATYINRYPYPDIAYYFWEKTTSGGCLVWYALLVNTKKDRQFVFWAFIVSCVRFTWQFVAFFTMYFWGKGIEPSDDWRVATCFCAMLVSAGVLMFLPNNRLTNFLNKYLIQWHRNKI